MFFPSDVPWALYAPPPFDLWLEPKLKLGHYHFLDTHVQRKNNCNLQQSFKKTTTHKIVDECTYYAKRQSNSVKSVVGRARRSDTCTQSATVNLGERCVSTAGESMYNNRKKFLFTFVFNSMFCLFFSKFLYKILKIGD